MTKPTSVAHVVVEVIPICSRADTARLAHLPFRECVEFSVLAIRSCTGLAIAAESALSIAVTSELIYREILLTVKAIASGLLTSYYLT